MATFLGFLTVESCDGSAVVNTFGEMVLKKNPECVRVVDRMFEASGVVYNHTLTVYGPTAFTASITNRLDGMPGLPLIARAPRAFEA